MNILITGGAGFIGSHTTEKLLYLGHKVTIIDNFSSGKIQNLNNSKNNYSNNLSIFEEDITKNLNNIFSNNFDVVFHFAAQMNVRKSVEDPINDAETNIIGSLNIIKNCIQHKVKKLIFSSSGGCVYGNTIFIPTSNNIGLYPICPYGIAKVTVENYLNYFRKNYPIDINVLRYANVYGPRQDPNSEAGVISIFIKKMLNNENPIIFGDGNQTRDFIYIDDIVDANIKIMNNNLKNHMPLNIGTEKETTVNELFNIINKFFNNKFVKIHKESKIGEIKRSALEISQTTACLNWKPDVYLDVGLGKTLQWIKNNDS